MGRRLLNAGKGDVFSCLCLSISFVNAPITSFDFLQCLRTIDHLSGIYVGNIFARRYLLPVYCVLI